MKNSQPLNWNEPYAYLLTFEIPQHKKLVGILCGMPLAGHSTLRGPCQTAKNPMYSITGVIESQGIRRNDEFIR